MASLAKRLGRHWRARYRGAAGKEHSHHFKRKVDAQRWLDEVTTAVTTGMYVDPGRSQITVGDWAQHWIETKVNLKPSTHARYEGLLRVSVLPRWKNVELVDVTHKGGAAWVASRRRAGIVEAVGEVGGEAVFSSPKSNQVRSVPIPRSSSTTCAVDRRQGAGGLRLHVAQGRVAMAHQLSPDDLRSRSTSRRPGRADTAKACATHHAQRRCEGRPADAGARRRDQDALSARPSVR